MIRNTQGTDIKHVASMDLLQHFMGQIVGCRLDLYWYGNHSWETYCFVEQPKCKRHFNRKDCVQRCSIQHESEDSDPSSVVLEICYCKKQIFQIWNLKIKLKARFFIGFCSRNKSVQETRNKMQFWYLKARLLRNKNSLPETKFRCVLKLISAT